VIISKQPLKTACYLLCSDTNTEFRELVLAQRVGEKGVEQEPNSFLLSVSPDLFFQYNAVDFNSTVMKLLFYPCHRAESPALHMVQNACHLWGSVVESSDICIPSVPGFSCSD